VNDTEEAESSFDGITYSKGASALKQLMSLISEAHFLQGANLYFRGHAFGNATRGDFFDAISNAASRNLKIWENEWLMTSGTNTVSVDLKTTSTAGSATVQSLELVQTQDPYTLIYRTHFTNVGLFYLENGKLKLKKTIPIEYSGPRTVITAAAGEKAPDFCICGRWRPRFL